MITFINYLIEVNLGLVFFYAIYWLLLKNENQFGFNRIYLMGSLCASLLFPAFTFESQSLVLIPSLGEAVPAHWLPEITVYGDGQATPEKVVASASYWTWITYAYITIAAIILVIFIFRLVEITRLFITARRYAWKNYTVAESAKVKGVFSFFRFIFLSPAENLDEQEKLEILRHEEVHIQKLHSFDILLINVIGIVCWFNPVIKSYKKSLVQIHEFEADARSVEGRDVNEYCGLLAKVALQSHGYVLANHFTNSFTIKRINKMKTVRNKIKQWKVVTVSVTVLMIFFAVACQDQILNEISDSTLTQVAEFPDVVKNDIASKYQAKYPEAKFNYIEGDADEIREKFSANAGAKQILLNTYPFPDRNIVGVLTVDVSNLELKDQNEVYSVVEEPAEPKGGMTEFYNYVAANLKYPDEARTKGVEGRVFIEFVVNEDGSISDARPIKGIGAGCDEEAAKIVAMAEPWKPGKQHGIAVKQRMVIPIIYSLDNSSNPVGKIEEVKQSMKASGNLVQENGKYFMVGKVTNTEGKPIAGMNIVLAGSTRGTVSNSNGDYKLEVLKEPGSLVFSFIGFKTESIAF